MNYTTLSKVKSAQYTNLPSDSSFDVELETLIEDISQRAEAHLDHAVPYADITEVPKSINDAIAKQVAYEFRRRKDTGLSSVSFPDGSVNKFDTGEWIKGVEQTLNGARRIKIL